MPLTTSRDGIDQAIQEANKAAGKNQCLGQDVSLTGSGDLIFGIWNPYTRKFDTSRPRIESNAVQVIAGRTTSRGDPIKLYIAPILGTSTDNIETIAIAYIDGNPDNGYSVIGLNGVSGNGNHASVHGSVASNGDINLGNADVYGDVRAGGDISQNKNSDITGWQGPLFTPLSFPNASVPWDAQLLTWNNGNGNGHDWWWNGHGNGNSDLTLDGSFNRNNPKDYKVIGKFDPRGDISVSAGYVAIYVSGDVKINGNQISQNNDPMQLRIYVVGNHTVDIGGNVTQKLELYAPQSSVTIHGNGSIYGSIIGKTVAFEGDATIRYDGSNAFGPLPPYKIKLVQ